MQIQRGQTLFGHPILAMRELMRAWSDNSDGLERIEAVLAVSGAAAEELLAALLLEGFVEESSLSRAGERLYGRTVRGAALAQATAAKPITRALASVRLRELVFRMSEVNANEEFLVGVEEAVVFGSYLTDAPTLGDLDISYKTYRKISDAARFMKEAERAARASRRRFSSHLDILFWPERQLRLFLKSGSRVYSLAHDEPLLQQRPDIARRFIFRDRRPADDR